MTQLLISVKNVKETLIVLDAGVDIIDLKDPDNGALGALDIDTSANILQAISGTAIVSATTIVSATVGEHHASLNDLIFDIRTRVEIGADIVKIAVSELFYEADFMIEMVKLTNEGVKIVAVFFADESIDLNLLKKSQQMGFFGAMLDTKSKQQNLLQVQAQSDLQIFTQKCNQHQLKYGFAGSLISQDIVNLIKFNPTYIGFRGGVCENNIRKSALSPCKVLEVKNMLHTHNKINEKAQNQGLALHS